MAVLIAALVLTYQAKGFGVDKKGNVIQSGLTFFSSAPNPASIYVNNKKSNYQTNSRVVLPAGLYDIKLTRDGYYDWNRKIDLGGGDVQHYDYPFLFPATLTTTNYQNYNGNIGLMTQSPDKRWLILQKPSAANDLSLSDLKNYKKAPQDITLPVNLLTKPKQSEAWGDSEWADDNQHVLLTHIADGKAEFILVDRTAPEKSLNLNAKFGVSPTKITLVDRKFDNFYLFDATSGSLQSINLNDQAPKSILSGVINYKSYGKDQILFVTADGAQSGKVVAKLLSRDKSYTIRAMAANSNYSLDLTKYSGVMYMVIGSSVDGKAYIYKDPLGQLGANPALPPGISQLLKVDQLSAVGFSPNAQYIVAENGQKFAVYDIENKLNFNYLSPYPLDQPQTRALWMDGNRLTYVSGGKVVVFDYDGINRHVLVASDSKFATAFAPDYKFLYTANPPQATGQSVTQTWLLAPQDR
jgi:hypothetical protein